jgi:raffinose/stachyose/melibiose transport system permease protein
MRNWTPSLLLQQLIAQAVLLAYTVLAVFPVVIIIMNAFKTRKAIFGDPFALPTSETFTLVGFETLTTSGNFPLYFLNSTIVVLASVFFIMLFGSMMAFALSEYKFRGSTLLSLYMSAGIMIPIRLGTVSIIQLMKSLGLIDTLPALILVYVAAGLPLAVFILTSFMQNIPHDLKDAARVDGASEYRIFTLVVPLIRPALGTVAVFNIIPVWNDLWFPLVLTSSDRVKTITYGSQAFMGQFANDYNAILASLTLAMVPVIVLYIIFSRQLVRGLTSGAVK